MVQDNLRKGGKQNGGGQIIFNNYQSNARGVAILIRKNIKTTVHKSIKDIHGRYLILDISIQNTRVILANCYGPNSDDPSFFEEFMQQVQSLSVHNIILAGDLNITLTPLDIRGTNPTNPKAAKLFKTKTEYLELCDIWRTRNPNIFQFTWKKARPKCIMERLDYVFVSEALSTKITEAKILPAYNSDHSFPYIKIKLDKGYRSGILEIEYISPKRYRIH